jgi:hypothetical protein
MLGTPIIPDISHNS